MPRKLSANGLKELKSLEGKRLKAYRDTNGTWTVGYGHTSAAGEPKVTSKTVFTDKQADQVLFNDLKQYEADVERLVEVPLNDSQFDALVIFHFNTGELDNSTLLRKLNKGDYDAVPSELAKWVYETIEDPVTKKKKKVRNTGLVNRRAREAVIWMKDAPVANSNVPVAKESAPIITKENVSFGAGIAASVGTAGSLFEGAGPIQYALALVIVVGLVVGLYYFIKRRRDK